MEGYELERIGVRELRRICKEHGKKKYAWLKKIELIFLIQEYSTSCGNCDGNLTIEEMQKYLEDPEEYGGVNTDDEYVPCCFNCYEYEREPCSICDTIYMNSALEYAIMEGGDEGLVCIHCVHCSECSELITEAWDGGIKEENWQDDTLYCDDCIPKTCYLCKNTCKNKDTLTGMSINRKIIDICDTCNKCSSCEYGLEELKKGNWDLQDKIYCKDCIPRTCNFCKKIVKHENTLSEYLLNDGEVFKDKNIEVWEFIENRKYRGWKIAKDPDMNSEEIGTLKMEDKFFILDKVDEWFEIKFNEIIGWIRWKIPPGDDCHEITPYEELVPNKYIKKFTSICKNCSAS
jgi:hypothetical protein